MQTIKNNTPKVRSIRTLKQWIKQGQLPAGELLPPENDLARLLNVSRTTLRAAVKAIEEEGLLQYQENRRRVVVGATQRAGTLLSNTIVILTNIDDSDPPGNDDTAKSLGATSSGRLRFVQAGLIDAIQKAGLHALTLQSNFLHKTQIRSIAAEHPHGLVIIRPTLHTATSMELIEQLHANGVPVVCFDAASNQVKFDTVASDHEAGCYNLTRWLIAKGRRRIQPLWQLADNPVPEWRKQRRAGYERAMRESHLEPLPTVEYPPITDPMDASPISFQKNVRTMVGYLYEFFHAPEPADALMALTDGDSFAMAAACRILKREPGRDVSIVGYDNYWQGCPERMRESFVPEATVDKLNIRLGQELMTLMQERTQGALPPEPQMRLIKPELKITGEL